MRLHHSLLQALLFTGATLGAEDLTPEKVEGDITIERLQGDVRKLNDIATSNNGTRASGTPGFKASVEFVVSRLKEQGPGQDQELDVQVQPFKFVFDQKHEIKLTGPDEEAVHAASVQYNSATPQGGITAELVDTPVDDEAGSACVKGQWKGINATGKIALVKRGGCTIADKVELAKAHGAVAVVLYNQVPGADIVPASLGLHNLGKLPPVVIVTLETGAAWSKRLAGGGKVAVSLLVDVAYVERETWNVLAQTTVGDSRNVIMLGAHLDSVVGGPGINDDGSGVAALLGIADSFKKHDGFNHAVRFAFWGAEERGLRGSLHYTETLISSEADAIRYYFNYDMIGSLYPRYKVLADTSADKLGGSKLLRYLNDHDKPATFGEFGQDSDYVGFIGLGIPCSGISTGAGEPFDTCYHRPCDDYDNINWDALGTNTKTAGSVTAHFALNLEGVPRREKPESIRGEGVMRRNGDI